jgi:MscS family membrane protein
VLDRSLWVELDEMSAAPEGDLEDGLDPSLELIEGKTAERDAGSLYLQRVARDGAEIWLVSAATVERVPQLYARVEGSGIAHLLPPMLVDTRFLEIALWQWLALIVLLIGAYVAAWIAASLLIRALRPIVARSRSELDDKLLELTLPALRLLGTIAFFAAGLELLVLTVPAQRFFDGLNTIGAVIGVAWLCFAGIDLMAGVIRDTMRKQGKLQATYLVPLGARTLKAAVGALVLLAGLDNLGVDVTTVIAGLGVGGLAVALALRPTLENVFGGITVLVDQPVVPGEFCRWDGDKVGTVEEVGLRSTRLRTLDRTVVSVPNGEFSNLQIENFARRDRIRLITTLNLRYETSADQLRHVLSELRRLLRSHPRVIDDPCRVRFVGFGASSLDLEIFAYVDTTDFNDFLAVREDLFLRMIDVVEASGTGFAFPSTTTYFTRDGGLDEEKKAAAEAQVAQWRAEGALAFPEFTPETIRALADTLDWPPRGSVLATKAKET